MNEIYDSNGKLIGMIALSERNLELLNRGIEITIQYHTPQLMRAALGDTAGSFALAMQGGQIRVIDPTQLKTYCDLQTKIAETQRVA